MPRRTIAILATLDTKGAEVAYIRDSSRRVGIGALVVDTGLIGEPATRRRHFQRASGGGRRRVA